MSKDSQQLDHMYRYHKDYTYTKINNKVDFYALQEGEVYVRPNGTDPVIVTDIDMENQTTNVLYFSGNIDRLKPQFMWATKRKLKENTKEENMTLYQIKDTETYGTHIATNSKGHYVLELKGSGEVVAKDKKDIEKVVPYTVNLKFLSWNSGKEYAYFSKEGDVRVGDLVKVGSGMAMITAVDTHSTKATKDLEGYVVVTKKIGE